MIDAHQLKEKFLTWSGGIHPSQLGDRWIQSFLDQRLPPSWARDACHDILHRWMLEEEEEDPPLFV